MQQVTDSGLRGRGGAAFPTGIKWQTVLNTAATQKYIVCNADEGDSGTFADRMLMEGDPFVLIEGMTIAALAVGATQGYIYVRSEYPHSIAVLNEAIDVARKAGYLGSNILNSGKSFELEVRKAAGAYVCGEETALLESLEGKRGIVRAKPPLPAIAGLFGKPTVINNVISLASVPIILAKGAAYYKDYGMGRSRGTLPFQLAGNIKQGGLIEKAFGVTLRELLYDFGGGSASGRPIKAVQVGGPLGAYLPESQWDTPLDYEAYTALWAVLGHGGIVVHDDSADLAKLARYAMKFCAIESCGKCTPCRIGATRGVEVMDKIIAGQDRPAQVELLRDLCDTMLNGSMCAMGGMTPYPVLSALNHFPKDFGWTWRRRKRTRPQEVIMLEQLNEKDFGTPRRISEQEVTLEIDGMQVTVAAGTSIMRAAAEGGVNVPKLCATDSLEPFGSCRLCLVEIEGRKGYPASCTTPAEQRHEGAHPVAQVAGAAQGRDGAVHLRPPAGLPDLRGERQLRIAGHGRRHRAARGALRLRRRESSRQQEGRIESLFHLRPFQVHRVQPLRARLRGNPGHLCADDLRARFRVARLAGTGPAVHGLGMRVVRRVRAGLPDRDAAGKNRDRAGTGRAQRGDDLRLLRRGLFLQGGDEGQRSGAHGPLQGRPGQ